MNITKEILKWYDNNQRILPWREDKDPYKVWVSEIMLQQTRVETVIPYFNRFIDKLPTINDLAQIYDDELNKLWEGLGYYSRVRNLKKAAIKVVNEFDGVIPNTQNELESLPGIGPYTSGAILSIAYEKPYTAVDGNVLRVFSRVFGIKENIKDIKTKKAITKKVEELLPSKRIGDFNQALMEIGATVCLPSGKPKCERCPLHKKCVAKNDNLTDVIPHIERKIKRTTDNITVYIQTWDGLIAVERRPETGLLAGLYQFPNVLGKVNNKGEYSHSYTHVFTHKTWNVDVYSLEEYNPNYIWVTMEELKNSYSIPTAFIKALNEVR